MAKMCEEWEQGWEVYWSELSQEDQLNKSLNGKDVDSITKILVLFVGAAQKIVIVTLAFRSLKAKMK